VGDTTILSGAKIGPGNSPGTLNIAGDLTWSAGGSYDWEIYNTVGAAGSEWDLIDVDGSLLFSGLSSGNTFTINIFSLSALPNTVGALAGWNSATNWSWTILSAGTGMGAFDANNFTLNTANFSANSLDGGTFSLAANGGDLNLLFTAGGGPGPSPVPEPGTWAAAALLAGAAGYARWRRRKEQTKVA
jgi:fibronectin-binding autotransporter adhesin